MMQRFSWYFVRLVWYGVQGERIQFLEYNQCLVWKVPYRTISFLPMFLLRGTTQPLYITVNINRGISWRLQLPFIVGFQILYIFLLFEQRISMASLKLSSVSKGSIARSEGGHKLEKAWVIVQTSNITNVLGKGSQFYAIPQTKQINKTGCQSRTWKQTNSRRESILQIDDID